ncbi:MAG: gliding motility-associated C-terminal domain-containing protein, partial [Bacteroidia bacterium]
SGGSNYVWSNAATSASIWAAQPGVYVVTASNLCGSDTAQTLVSFLPGATASITASGPLSICPGDSLQLTASGGSSYVWSNAATTSSIWVTQTGSYVVTATGVCGSDTASVSITQQPGPAASVTASGPLSICAGDSVQLSASGGNSYVWSTASTSAAIWVTQPGTYIVNASNNCGSDTAQVQIAVLPAPSVQITPSGPQTLCPGDSLLLTATGNGSYLWSTGATSAAVYATGAGTYSVTATNVCGTASATQIITAGVLPNATVSGNTIICIGDTTLLTATGGSSYIWSTGSTASSIAANTGGVYTVIASNSCGSDTAQITVSITQAFASFTADTVTGNAPLAVNFTDASSSNTVAWLWDFGNGNTSAIPSPDFTFTSAGTYNVTLTVTNTQGCTDVFSMTIIVTEDPSFLQMPNVFTPNGDGINDLFLATAAGIETFDMHIYDRWGIEVSHLTRVNQGWDGRTTSGVEVTEGTYYFVLRAAGFDQRVYDLTGFLTLLRN